MCYMLGLLQNINYSMCIWFRLCLRPDNLLYVTSLAGCIGQISDPNN